MNHVPPAHAAVDPAGEASAVDPTPREALSLSGVSALRTLIEHEKLLARIFSRVEPSGACWLWIGHRVQGYGSIRALGQQKRAHRLAFELLVGSVPDGMSLDHLCRNRACVNPTHLEPVSNRENVLRGVGPSAENARRTHCKRGHQLTPENTRHYNQKNPRIRTCLMCKRMYDTGRRMWKRLIA